MTDHTQFQEELHQLAAELLKQKLSDHIIVEYLKRKGLDTWRNLLHLSRHHGCRHRVYNTGFHIIPKINRYNKKTRGMVFGKSTPTAEPVKL
jgi:hypothetical protein